MQREPDQRRFDERRPDADAREGGWVLAGRYRIVDRLGAGGMAEVFRAHDVTLARDVAIKVFRTRPPAVHVATDAERQRRELQALATLNHPNLIALFDGAVAPTQGPPFLVMELVGGPTLAEPIKAAALSEAQVRDLGIQLADALTYVHARGMVHRDVKPGNILLGGERPDGASFPRARLSDFGIVRLLGSEPLTSVDATLGTASYLAPEQARGVGVGPAADVYSLALVLIEALTGARSFDGPPLQAAMARLMRAPELPDHLPAPWPELLSAMTATDPAARLTAQQVAETLREATTASAVAVPAAVAPEAEPVDVGSAAPEPTSRRGWGWLVAAAIATVLVGGGGLAYQLARPESAPVGGPSTTSSSTPRSSSPSIKSHGSRNGGPQVAVYGTTVPAAAPRSRSSTSDPSSAAPSSSSSAPRTSTRPSTSASTTPSNPPPSTSTTSAASSSATASSSPTASNSTTTGADTATSSAAATTSSSSSAAS